MGGEGKGRRWSERGGEEEIEGKGGEEEMGLNGG